MGAISVHSAKQSAKAKEGVRYSFPGGGTPQEAVLKLHEALGLLATLIAGVGDVFCVVEVAMPLAE